MIRPLPRLAAPLAAAAALAACQPQANFPSLAVRPAELAADVEPAPPPPAPVDPGLGSRIEELVARAREGEAQFRAALPAASRAVAAAGGSGSESWVAAQQQISLLEAVRAPTVNAVAELDRLGIERGLVPTDPGQWQALTAATREAAEIAAAQRAEIERLNGAVSAP